MKLELEWVRRADSKGNAIQYTATDGDTLLRVHKERVGGQTAWAWRAERDGTFAPVMTQFGFARSADAKEAAATWLQQQEHKEAK